MNKMLKKFLNLVLVIWWCIMFVYVSAISKPNNENRYVFATARCRARCYTKYLIDQRLTTLKPWSWSPQKCNYKDRKCNMCYNVCGDKLFLSDVFGCDDLCKSSIFYQTQASVCMDACNFIYNIIQIGEKAGACPVDNTANTDSLLSECNVDWECVADKKCCKSKSDRLQKSCLSSKNFTNKDVPINLAAKKVEKSALQLSWKMSTSSNPTRLGMYFLIEMRHALSKDYIHSVPWEYLHQTSSLRKRIEGVRSGIYYQFRVAAVSRNGNNGYSKLVDMFIPKHGANKPMRPKKFMLKELNNTDLTSIQVLLSWEAPEIVVGHLRKYKLIYFKSLSFFDASLEYKKSIKKTAKQIVIQDLLPNTEYEFELFAVTVVKHVSVRGSKAKIKHLTKSLPDTAKKKRIGVLTAINNVLIKKHSKHLKLRMSDQIQASVANVTYKNREQSSMTFQWKLLDSEVNEIDLTWFNFNCTSSFKRRFDNRIIPSSIKIYTLSYLYTFCHYNLKIKPLFPDGKTGEEVVLNFHTWRTRKKAVDPNKSSATTPHFIFLHFLYLFSICLFVGISYAL